MALYKPPIIWAKLLAKCAISLFQQKAKFNCGINQCSQFFFVAATPLQPVSYVFGTSQARQLEDYDSTSNTN